MSIYHRPSETIDAIEQIKSKLKEFLNEENKLPFFKRLKKCKLIFHEYWPILAEGPLVAKDYLFICSNCGNRYWHAYY